MSSIFKRRKGRSSTSRAAPEPENTPETQEIPPPPAVLPLPGYEHVVFKDYEQRNKFELLEKLEHEATRFLSTTLMLRFGLDSALREIFRGTGLLPLYGMSELTYKDLTLEFLSSFWYNASTKYVFFRLCNRDHDMTLSQLCDHFGFAHEVVNEWEVYSEEVWEAITGIPEREFKVSNLKMSAIQDPRLKIWFKVVAYTIFGRDNADKTSKVELSIMGTFLNLNQEDQYQFDVTAAMCDHFVKAAGGKVLKKICFGGLITFLARRLCGFDGTGYHAPLSTFVPLIDEPYMINRLFWVVKESNTSYLWRVAKDHHIRMPLSYLPMITSAPKVIPPRRKVDLSYLIPKEGVGAASSSAGPSTFQHHEGGSAIPPTVEQPATDYNQGYNYGSFDPNSYYEQRHAWERVNDNLLHYQQYNSLFDAGVVRSTDVHPTYWTGRDSYPGFVFDEYNVNQSEWGPQYHTRFGGGAGQFLPPDVTAPRGDGSRQSRGGRRRNDRSRGGGSMDLD